MEVLVWKHVIDVGLQVIQPFFKQKIYPELMSHQNFENKKHKYNLSVYLFADHCEEFTV